MTFLELAQTIDVATKVVDELGAELKAAEADAKQLEQEQAATLAKVNEAVNAIRRKHEEARNDVRTLHNEMMAHIGGPAKAQIDTSAAAIKDIYLRRK